MPWHAQLRLDYSVEAGRTVARHTHSGPLRILQSLYPEGDSVCHNVLVHPPGDELMGWDAPPPRSHVSRQRTVDSPMRKLWWYAFWRP